MREEGTSEWGNCPVQAYYDQMGVSSSVEKTALHSDPELDIICLF